MLTGQQLHAVRNIAQHTITTHYPLLLFTRQGAPLARGNSTKWSRVKDTQGMHDPNHPPAPPLFCPQRMLTLNHAPPQHCIHSKHALTMLHPHQHAQGSETLNSTQHSLPLASKHHRQRPMVASG